MKKITIGIADDHQLFLKSLTFLINSFNQFVVTIEALHGKDLIEKLNRTTTVPDIIILDVNMPVMDGKKTAEYLSIKYPDVKLVALSMNDDDISIISMIKAGCRSYLLKDINPDELEKALLSIDKFGSYKDHLIHLLQHENAGTSDDSKLVLSEREMQLLELCCTEKTYKEMADIMKVSTRTLDTFRERLCIKLGVQTRAGIILEAIRRNIISL